MYPDDCNIQSDTWLERRCIGQSWDNKANLRDMIAVTGLVILLKFDSNHRFFRPYDLEIWWMTSKNNRAPFLYYAKLCASFQNYRGIQTGITIRKRLCRVKIGDFVSRVTLKFDGWPWKITGHIFYTTLSFVNHFKAIGDFKLEFQSGNAQFGSKSEFFVPCDLEIWQMTLKNNRAHLLCCFKLCALFHSHQWFETGGTVQKRPIWVKIEDVFCPVWAWNLTDDHEKQ